MWMEFAALLIGAVGVGSATIYAARRDQRDARTEFQKSIEAGIENAVKPLADQIKKVDDDLGVVKQDIVAVREDVAYMRGRMDERRGG